MCARIRLYFLDYEDANKKVKYVGFIKIVTLRGERETKFGMYLAYCT